MIAAICALIVLLVLAAPRDAEAECAWVMWYQMSGARSPGPAWTGPELHRSISLGAAEKLRDESGV